MSFHCVFITLLEWNYSEHDQVLTGLSGLIASLIGRPEDAITAAITTTVVLIVAEVSPHDAWQQPILRLADAVIGVAVGLSGAWLVRRMGEMLAG